MKFQLHKLANNTENMLHLISCSVGHGLSMNKLNTASPVLGLYDPITVILLLILTQLRMLMMFITQELLLSVILTSQLSPKYATEDR